MGNRDRPMGSFVSKYDAIHVQPDSPTDKKGGDCKLFCSRSESTNDSKKSKCYLHAIIV